MNKQELNNKLKQSFNAQLMENDSFLSEFQDLKTCFKVRAKNNEKLREKIQFKHNREQYISFLMSRPPTMDKVVTTNYYEPVKANKKQSIRVPKKIKSLIQKDNFLHITYSNTFKHILPLYTTGFRKKLKTHEKHILRYSKTNQLPYTLYGILNIEQPKQNPINTNQYLDNVLR